MQYHSNEDENKDSKLMDIYINTLLRYIFIQINKFLLNFVQNHLVRKNLFAHFFIYKHTLYKHLRLRFR